MNRISPAAYSSMSWFIFCNIRVVYSTPIRATTALPGSVKLTMFKTAISCKQEGHLISFDQRQSRATMEWLRKITQRTGSRGRRRRLLRSATDDSLSVAPPRRLQQAGGPILLVLLRNVPAAGSRARRSPPTLTDARSSDALARRDSPKDSKAGLLLASRRCLSLSAFHSLMKCSILPTLQSFSSRKAAMGSSNRRSVSLFCQWLPMTSVNHNRRISGCCKLCQPAATSTSKVTPIAQPLNRFATLGAGWPSASSSPGRVRCVSLSALARWASARRPSRSLRKVSFVRRP